MDRKKFDTLITTIDNVPPLPEVSSAVMEALEAEEVNVAEIADLIEKDISLASQILKVANSAAYGGAKKVSSIHHAMIMLGLNEIKVLLLALAVEKFVATSAKNTEVRKRYWTHSQVCSYAALLLAQHFRLNDRGSFFLAGLVHDIGKLIIDQFFHDEFEQIVDYIAQHNCSFNEAEREILGATHSQVGGKLLQNWNFPPQIIAQVFRHHEPWKDPEYNAEVLVIFLANNLTKIAGHKCLIEERTQTLDEFSASRGMDILQNYGLKAKTSDLAYILDQIKEFSSTDTP